MTTLHASLLFLHVLSISAWLAAALWVPGDVKRALALGGPHPGALAAAVRPKLGLDAAAGIAAIASGLLLMWEASMTRPRLGITLGIGFAVLRLGLLASMRRAFRGLAARVAAGEPAAAGDPSARRMSMLAGMAHAAWLVALAGMIFPV